MTEPVHHSYPTNAEHVLEVRRTGAVHYVVGVFLNSVVFAAFGPLIGGCILTTLIGITSVGNPFAGIMLHLMLAPLTVPVSYLLAAPASALTGAVVAFGSIWIVRPLYLHAFTGGIGAIASFVGIARADRARMASEPWSFTVMLLLSGVVAALICTRIARPFRLGPLNSVGAEVRPASKSR